MVERGIRPKDVELLKDDELFVKHLGFHECAHTIYLEYSDVDCDVWAFNKLKNDQN
jgi:hypothetical protein